MFDNFHDAMEEAVYRAPLDGKIYGLVQKVDKIVVRIVRKSVPNKFMWTTRRVKKMATTITKNWVSSDNKLFKARVKDGVEQIKVDGKWQNLTERGRYIKTKTLYVTFVNHKSGVSKSFKQGKRYQVDMTASLGQNAGKIFDEDGDAWSLIRSDDVGFSTVCGTYKYESQYK